MAKSKSKIMDFDNNADLMVIFFASEANKSRIIKKGLKIEAN